MWSLSVQRRSPRWLGLVLLAAAVACASASHSANAGIIKFKDANGKDTPIIYTKPTVFDPWKIDPKEPEPKTKTPLDDGFRLTDLSYTISRPDGGLSQGMQAWLATREFTLDADCDVIVQITGNTKVTLTGKGELEFFVTALLDRDGANTARFEQHLTAAFNDKELKWDESVVIKGVKKGTHTLKLASGIHSWAGDANPDKITVSSLYEVNVAAVPEPAAVTLFGLGALSLAGYRLWRRRRARSARDAPF